MKKNRDDFLAESILSASEAAKSDAEGIKRARARINEIIDKIKGRSLIFRGESKKYSKEEITSSLYRHYCMPREEDTQIDKLQEERQTLLKHFPALEMTAMIIDSAREHFEEGKSAIGILTGLQHQGGKTALIDFTRSVYIALYFACNNHLNEDGQILMIEEEKIENLDENEFSKTIENLRKKEFSEIFENLSRDEFSENLRSVSNQTFDSHDDEESESKIYRVNPIGKEPRVVFQSSVFVFPVRGFLKKKELCVIEIKKDLKKYILKCLSIYNGIEDKTIYNDVQGFIQRSPSDQYMYFFQAMIFYKEGKYDDAIEKYNQAIEINSKFFEAYRNRGIAKFALEKYEKAIADYDKALGINPEDTDAYFNRGNSELALLHYKKAIADYDRALKFNPEYIFTYSNRGIANIKDGRDKEAIEDFKQALRLSRQQGNEEMAKKMKVLLRTLEGNPKNSPTDQ